MNSNEWNRSDSVKAKIIWEKYSGEHDLSQRKGQTAGIDPESGRIWFGESIRVCSTKEIRRFNLSCIF